jgi:hypothetical protein
VQEIADFEKNWESNSQNLKPSAKHRRKQYYGQNKYSNQTQTMSELKTKIKTVFII